MKQTELDTMVETLICAYAEELSKMKRTKDYPIGLTPKSIGDIKAGYSDGVRATLNALRCKGALKVEG